MYHHRRDDVHFPCPSFGKLVIGGNPNVLNMAHQSVRTPFARLFIQNNFKVIKLFIFIWISVTLLILINIKNNTKSSLPSIYYYSASSVALHRTPTNRNSAKIDPNLILAQFDTTEDGTLYDSSTGNKFRIFSV